MASKEGEKKLSDMYDEAYALYEEVQNTDQPTNCGMVQVRLSYTSRKFNW